MGVNINKSIDLTDDLEDDNGNNDLIATKFKLLCLNNSDSDSDISLLTPKELL